ncbi:MAG: ABC transporter ATP-binding protein [Oscillospiraceae bacterium]|nr:ABC transporter ATP-binding protein [Oscillospiraceae bacterium]
MSVFKKFISYYKPYRVLFWVDMGCALLLSAIDLAFPQILDYLTENVFNRPAEQVIASLKIVAIALLVMYAIKFGCQYFITGWGHIMGARMESDMRQDLFDHYQKLSFSYYDKNNTGEMMSKIVNDLFDVTELAHHGPENIVIATIKIIGSFGILLFINIPMTLILMAVCAVMIAFCIRQNRKLKHLFMENRKKIAGVNSSVQDSLAGIRVVKSFTGEHVEQEKFRTSNNRFLVTKENNYFAMGTYHATNGFFQGILYTSVLVAGGYFIAQGSIDATDLALYALYIGIFLKPVDMLIDFTELLQKGYTGFVRFKEVIDIAPEIQDSPDAVELGDIKGEITLSNVSFNYDDDEKVLQDISLTIESGKTIALVGPSGGGKTTICSLIPRFYDVTKGSIKLDGKDIKEIKQKSLRQNIGIVQQDVYMFYGTIRDNIAYGKAGATDEEIIEAAKKANIHDFIISLPDGYNTFVGERGTRLSGGQKQRISIARVFLKNPPILILDEATSALDNESERYIQRSLEQLSEGRTTLVIAHRLSTIRNADKIYVIEEGRIKEQGSHAELLAENGLYAKYYNMQFEDK